MQQDIAESPWFLNVWAWFEKNRKPVLVGVIAVAAAGALAGLMAWSKKQKTIQAGEALSQAMLAQMMSADRTQAAEGMLKVAAAHTGTPAGAQALLLGAGALFASGQHAEAQAEFEKFSREYVGHPLTPQAKLGQAACLAALGKPEEAARTYKDLAERYPNANTVSQARFALAGIYETQGKLDEAHNLFEQVARADMNSSLGAEAGMRAEEIRARLPPMPPPIPEIAPAAISVVTNTPASVN